MGRTLFYHIYGDLEGGQIPELVRQRILVTQRLMNEQFTWRAEDLALEFVERPESARAPDPPHLGGGFSKVYGDDWNAELIVRLFQWVSELLPTTCFIRLADEGASALRHIL